LKNNPEIAKNTYKKVIPLVKSILKSFFKITLQTTNTHKILFSICEKHGLLPKDALLLAICIENDINNLITLDKDFCNLSLEESINIISTYRKLEKI
jgi:predicted nucleic acid-binding protein